MKLSRAFSVSIIPSLTICRKSLQTSILRFTFGVVRNCKHTYKFSFRNLMDFMSSLAQSLRKFVKFLITATLVSSPILFSVIFLLMILNISLSLISFSGYFNQTCDMASKPTSKYYGFWSFFLRIAYIWDNNSSLMGFFMPSSRFPKYVHSVRICALLKILSQFS